MTRFQSIMAATDFSVNGNHAVRTAARLAAHSTARLTLLHVTSSTGCKPLRQWFGSSIDVDLKVAQARATLRRFAAEITGRYAVPVRHKVVIGDTFDEILQASQGVDLLVLGRRGTSRLEDLVIGSAADRLLRQCQCAMLVVKQWSDDYRRVLVPVDFTLHSQASLEAANAVAPRADIHVLHVLGPEQELEMQRPDVPHAVRQKRRELESRNARDRIEQLIATADIDHDVATAKVARGNAWCSALDQERSLGADLIVAGKQGSSTVADFVLGSVARRLLTRSRSDMLIIPRSAAAGMRLANAAAAIPARAGASARSNTPVGDAGTARKRGWSGNKGKTTPQIRRNA